MKATSPWLAYVGVAGLLFGVWQFVDARAQQYGRLEAVVEQLEQVVIDLRARLTDVERMQRYVHGEEAVPR